MTDDLERDWMPPEPEPDDETVAPDVKNDPVEEETE